MSTETTTELRHTVDVAHNRSLQETLRRVAIVLSEKKLSTGRTKLEAGQTLHDERTGESTVLTGLSAMTDLSNRGNGHGEAWVKTKHKITSAPNGYPVDERNANSVLKSLRATEKRLHIDLDRIPHECTVVIDNLKTFPAHVAETSHPWFHLDWPECQDKHCTLWEHENIVTRGGRSNNSQNTQDEKLKRDSKWYPEPRHLSYGTQLIDLRCDREKTLQHDSILVSGPAKHLDLLQQMSACPGAGNVQEWSRLNLAERKLHPYVVFSRESVLKTPPCIVCAQLDLEQRNRPTGMSKGKHKESKPIPLKDWLAEQAKPGPLRLSEQQTSDNTWFAATGYGRVVLY